MTKRLSRSMILLGLAFATCVVLAWLLLSSALPSSGLEYRVKAVVDNVEGLAGGANVTIAGLKVGRVESVARRDGKGLIELTLQEGNGPIPEDSRFGVRLRTVVGENYLELYPGKSSTDLPSGGVLTQGAANEYVDVDEILDALRGKTRGRARDTLQSLGGAVEDRGDELNRTLGGAAGLIENAQAPLDALDDHRAQVSRLVDDLGAVTGAIGDRGTALRELVGNGLATTEAVAAQDDALRAMLDRLPGTLQQVRQTTTLLDGVSGRAAPVVANLGFALRDLQPAVTALQPAASEGRAVMRELDAVAPRLEGTLDRLVDLRPRAVRALPALRQAMCEINPTLAHLAPYAEDIAAFTQNFGSSGGYYDANAHAARLNVVVGQSSQPFADPATREALDTLVGDAFGQASLLRYNPLPGPGAGGLTASPEMATGRTQVTEPYPRVRAEC